MYNSECQQKNIAWYLPRPRPDHYKGGMPLYCEDWLLDLARDIIGKENPVILNLFSGMCNQGIRVDINEEVEPDYVCDAHELTKYVNHKFDIILADPPYSNGESRELYGTGDLNYKLWSKEADKLLLVGGLFIVYHKLIMPNPNPDKYRVVKRVFVGNRIWHLPRVAIYYKKTKGI